MGIKKFKGLSRYIGLMFRKIDTDTFYLFEFQKLNKYPVHTLFVRDTLGVIWFHRENNKVKIVDVQTVKPNKFYVTHKGLANGFIEFKYVEAESESCQ